jgi:hypothetical protein
MLLIRISLHVSNQVHSSPFRSIAQRQLHSSDLYARRQRSRMPQEGIEHSQYQNTCITREIIAAYPVRDAYPLLDDVCGMDHPILSSECFARKRPTASGQRIHPYAHKADHIVSCTVTESMCPAFVMNLAMRNIRYRGTASNRRQENTLS